MVIKTISISLSEDALDIIDKAAEKVRRTRSNYLEFCGVEKAQEIFKDEAVKNVTDTNPIKEL